MKMKAILYARWSSQEQKQGSTLQRQTELTERFSTGRGWPIEERVRDEGLSAYTGENLHSGNLGKLTARLERLGGAGTVIVVEKLDRLSRQPPLIMTNWMQRVCATGAAISTADGKHYIDATALNTNPVGIMGVIFEAFVGYQESQTKSDRGLDNWRIKRESGKPMTARCAAWLRLSADRSRYELISERAEIVVWICGQRDQRVHKDRIAAMLDAKGIKPWGGGKRWHGSYIEKITSSIALIGDHQHGMKRRSDKRRVRTGEIIKGYFPAVIDEALFARINSRRHREASNAQRRGTIANLFTGLARCSCGSIMTLKAKGRKTRADGRVVREDYLRCDSALRPGRAGGCGHRTGHNYAVFRDAVLDELLHRALDDQFFEVPDGIAALNAEAQRQARHRDDILRRMSAVLTMVEEDDTDAHAKMRYRTLKVDLQASEMALVAATAALEAARGAVSPARHLARVAEVRELMDADDEVVRNEARARVMMALNDLIEKCEFDVGGQQSALHLVGGIGLLLVSKLGETMWFDLAKRKATYEHLPPDTRTVVSAYLARRAA